MSITFLLLFYHSFTITGRTHPEMRMSFIAFLYCLPLLPLSNSRRMPYDVEPTTAIAVLLAEIDADRTRIS